MKRQYQIEQQRAVNEFRQFAANENPNIQMNLPMADLVGLLQQGVGHLLREAGLALMKLVMDEEVRHLAGERHRQHTERRAQRWGKEDGYCVIDGSVVVATLAAAWLWTRRPRLSRRPLRQPEPLLEPALEPEAA